PGTAAPGRHRRHHRVPAHARGACAHRPGAAGRRGLCLHMTAIMQRSAAGLSYLARDGGDGTPIVLLHGIGSNAQSFAPLMQALDRPALAWDAPGYGASEPLAAQWPDASDYAAAVDRWLAGIGVSRCI